MKISTYIFLSFLFILLLFSLTTYLTLKQSEEVESNNAFFANSSKRIQLQNRLRTNVSGAQTALTGYLLSNDANQVAQYDSAIIENESLFKELYNLTSDRDQTKIIREAERLHSRWVNEYTQPLRSAKLMSTADDSSKAAYQTLYDQKYLASSALTLQLAERFRDYQAKEYETRTERNVSLGRLSNQTTKIAIALIALSVITGFAIVTFLIRRIARRISKMVNMANTIASGNYDIQISDSANDELSALTDSLNHMSAELSKNISLLKSKNEELDQFAHIVSHDLKGPLRGIDNVISWIEEDHKEELTPKIAEYIQLIKGRVTRTENLIQGILSYARIDKEEISKEEVDVNMLLEEVLDTIPINDNIQVVWQEMPVLYTEKVPLFQVFANLISNSIKYNDKEKGMVEIFAKDRGSSFEFYVKDNGPGIAESYHHRIFVIFQTLKERDTFESTGVGLAIVKKILDGRKESIKVESEANKGATFSFTWSKT